MSATVDIQDVKAESYHAIHALSHSGMKDLAISPLRYWHLHINPDRPERRETPEIRFGTALHCAVLETKEFVKRYSRAIDPEDYPGCLVTMDDCRTWLKDKGIKPTGKCKAELVAQVMASDPMTPILDVLIEAQMRDSKEILTRDTWDRVHGAASSLLNSSQLRSILSAPDGQREVSYFTRDAETGVPLKARMDFVSPTNTIDLKTFSCTRGKSIDRTVADAIYYEGYFRQAYYYTTIRKLANPAEKPTFIFAFVESEPPYEVRLKRMEPGTVYWDTARIEIRNLIRLYADCAGRFGDSPWLHEQRIETLEDADIPQLAYC